MKDDIRDSAVDNAVRNDYHSGILGDGENLSTAENRLLTVQEICELLKVSKTYIYSLTSQKKIPHIKMHGHLRFRQSAIDEWLRSKEIHDAEYLSTEK
ncbi:helix-turn-helix domain-containing protein [Candidatus Poribacteria bacterium]|nr:helix-turn-helix domain-containing protein [Candidatus Poribacteria bacterium]